MVSRFYTTQCECPESYVSDFRNRSDDLVRRSSRVRGIVSLSAGFVLFLGAPLVGVGRHDVGGDRDARGFRQVLEGEAGELFERRHIFLMPPVGSAPLAAVEVVVGRVEQYVDPTKERISHRGIFLRLAQGVRRCSRSPTAGSVLIDAV